MTAKFLSLQEISLRPQNDQDKILLQNLNNLVISGKEASIKLLENNDLILEIKSKK